MSISARRSARLLLAAISIVATAGTCSRAPLRPESEALERAEPDLVGRLQADAFNYFRFVNRPWIARVCATFATELPNLPIVRIHGDAHIEQFAFTRDAWGLDDFDDTARGPAVVDILRFLGSIDLATRQRSWERDRRALFDRFFEGYRRGLTETGYRPPEPDIVRVMRSQAPRTRAEFLAWGEAHMHPMSDAEMNGVLTGMEMFTRVLRRERPDLPPEFFVVQRAGWLRVGVGSAASRKVLARLRGATDDPADDELLEAKEVANLDGLDCLEGPTARPALRIIDGTKQLGRLKHNILAAGPDITIPEMALRGRQIRDWWIRSWDESYQEVRLSDLRSVSDLSDIAYDSGVQLAAGSLEEPVAADRDTLRKRALASTAALEGRLRTEAAALVEDMLRGWEELRQRMVNVPPSP